MKKPLALAVLTALALPAPAFAQQSDTGTATISPSPGPTPSRTWEPGYENCTLPDDIVLTPGTTVQRGETVGMTTRWTGPSTGGSVQAIGERGASGPDAGDRWTPHPDNPPRSVGPIAEGETLVWRWTTTADESFVAQVYSGGQCPSGLHWDKFNDRKEVTVEEGPCITPRWFYDMRRDGDDGYRYVREPGERLYHGIVLEGEPSANRGATVYATTVRTGERRAVREAGRPTYHHTWIFSIGENTILDAEVPNVCQGKDLEPFRVEIRPRVSIGATRVAPRDYAFHGRVLPGRGQRVTLWRIEADGRRVLTSTSQVREDGTYRFERRFLRSGRFGFQVDVAANPAALWGQSPARPTVIH